MRDETLDDYLERNNLFLCRELTDEEIFEAWQEAKHTALNTKGNFVEVIFARAILRKAKE